MTEHRRADPPPLHEMDAHHALTLENIRHWVGGVYPSVVTEDADRTRQWFSVSARLFDLTYAAEDQRQGIALLAELAAELLLAHAEHMTGRGTT